MKNYPGLYKSFNPDLTPKEMLEYGVFGGSYLGNTINEYPKNWFQNAKISKTFDINLNYFKIKAGLSWRKWNENGWIFKEDRKGWFQWYCRYYFGRRILEEDDRQIKRWKSFRRHVGAIKKNCISGDLNCRVKQRQALLHWAYDSLRI